MTKIDMWLFADQLEESARTAWRIASENGAHSWDRETRRHMAERLSIAAHEIRSSLTIPSPSA